MRVCVGSPGIFSTRKCRSATLAICGRCVIVITCARSASRPQRLGDAMRGLAADAGVDLVEDHRLAARDGSDRQRDARELAARRGLRDGRKRQAAVQANEEGDVVDCRSGPDPARRNSATNSPSPMPISASSRGDLGREARRRLLAGGVELAGERSRHVAPRRPALRPRPRPDRSRRRSPPAPRALRPRVRAAPRSSGRGTGALPRRSGRGRPRPARAAPALPRASSGSRAARWRSRADAARRRAARRPHGRAPGRSAPAVRRRARRQRRGRTRRRLRRARALRPPPRRPRRAR